MGGRRFFIRDLHLFDERVVSATHSERLKATALAYETLPVMDGARWSSKEVRAGGWPVIFGADGKAMPLLAEGEPEIREGNSSSLVIVQGLRGGGKIEIRCEEKSLSCRATDESGKPVAWAWELRGNQRMKEALRGTRSEGVEYQSAEGRYGIQLIHGSVRSVEGVVRLVADEKGLLALNLSIN